MQFLRDSAMQGAGFIVAVLVMLLQFPEHITWLLPFSILFFSLLYLGHKYSPEKSQVNKVTNTNWENIWGSFTRFIKIWLTPTLTILIIFVSLLFTIRGIAERTNLSGQGIEEKLSAVEKTEFLVTNDTYSISLHSIVSEVILRDALFSVQPEIVFTKDIDGYLISQIRINNIGNGYNDSGTDPKNRIFEPNGSFESTSGVNLGGEYAILFPLKPQQTLFIRMIDGGTIRIHVDNLPKKSSSANQEEFLILTISYNSDSQRFYGLTTP